MAAAAATRVHDLLLQELRYKTAWSARRDAEETLARLIALLDSQDLARAIERLEKVQGLRGGELKSYRHSNRHDPPPE